MSRWRRGFKVSTEHARSMSHFAYPPPYIYTPTLTLTLTFFQKI